MKIQIQTNGKRSKKNLKKCPKYPNLHSKLLLPEFREINKKQTEIKIHFKNRNGKSCH